MLNTLLKINKIVSASAAIAFVLMYFILSFYNRMVFDDFSVVTSALKYGTFGGIVHWYFNLDGCVSNLLLHQTVEPFLFRTNLVYIFNWLTLVLLVGSLYLLLRWWNNEWRVGIDRTTMLISATLFIALAYLTAPHVTQCFYWVSSIIPYIYPFIFLFFAIAFLTKATHRNYFLVSCIFFFLFGLTRIHLVFLIFSIIGTYLFFFFLLQHKIDRRGVIIASIILLGIVITVAAPGNYKRQTIEATLNQSHPSFLFSLQYAFQKLFSKILENLRYFIIAIPLFLLVGGYFQGLKTGLDENLKKIIHFGLLKTALLGFSFLFGIYFLNATIMYMAVQNCYYTDRVWMHFFISILLLEFIIAGLIGYRYARFAVIYAAVACLMFAFTTYVFIKSIFIVLPHSREYARVYDLNIALIKQAKSDSRKDVLYLHSMPANSGFIQEWHVTGDTSFWVNQCLAYDYGLMCAVADSTR